MTKIHWPEPDLPPINQPVLISAYDFHNISSPCIKDCRVRDNACVGCGRTLEEIRDWSLMTEKEKLKVMERLDESDV